MRQSFKHKGLKELFEKGRSHRVRKDLVEKALRKLDAIDAADTANDLNLPGFGFHSLQGFNPTRYAVKVTANYRITFDFESGNSQNITLEDYH